LSTWRVSPCFSFSGRQPGLISSLLFSLLPYPPVKKAQAKAWTGQKAGLKVNLKAGCNLKKAKGQYGRRDFSSRKGVREFLNHAIQFFAKDRSAEGKKQVNFLLTKTALLHK